MKTFDQLTDRNGVKVKVGDHLAVNGHLTVRIDAPDRFILVADYDSTSGAGLPEDTANVLKRDPADLLIVATPEIHQWPGKAESAKPPLVYLASPWSHDSEVVRQDRFHAACKCAAKLVKAGHGVFSPIAHSVPLVPYAKDVTHADWMRLDFAILDRCDALLVLLIDGWEQSKGVRMEWDRAVKLGLKRGVVGIDGTIFWLPDEATWIQTVSAFVDQTVKHD